VSHLQSLPVTHHQLPGATCLGLPLEHGARLNPRCFTAKSSSFLNHCESENSRAARGRGFNSLERTRPATASTLMRRFFLVPESLKNFPGIKKSNLGRGRLCRRNKALASPRPSCSSICFLVASSRQTTIRKNVAKFPVGGAS
jgi:hypothetical protein